MFFDSSMRGQPYQSLSRDWYYPPLGGRMLYDGRQHSEWNAVRLHANYRPVLARRHMSACLVLLAAVHGNDVPAVLELAIQNRSNATLRSADVDWSVRTSTPGLSAIRFYTSRWAGSSEICIDRGDDNGVVVRDSAGNV